MKRITLSLTAFLLIFGNSTCQRSLESRSQASDKESRIGGVFQNAEYMYFDLPEEINSIDTSPGWNQEGQKLYISGKVYQIDGKTPAPDVVLYYYHTDIHGIYNGEPINSSKAKKHGYIRGWVKTNAQGEYSIYTTRPAPYPKGQEPAHIHISIKEPNHLNEYYIDPLVFDDDILLNAQIRKSSENRGGSGVLRLLDNEGFYVAEHNIILGLNIPNYPKSSEHHVKSGRSIGEDVMSFTPDHAWGPDKGKRACPVCKYGRHHGLLYFVGRHPDWQNIKSWLSFFEQESTLRSGYLKVYFIYGNDEIKESEKKALLEKLGSELNLTKVALTYVPSFTDQLSEVILNDINPNANNTMLIYRNRNIFDKYVNLEPSPQNQTKIKRSLDKNGNQYFHLKSIHEKE